MMIQFQADNSLIDNLLKTEALESKMIYRFILKIDKIFGKEVGENSQWKARGKTFEEYLESVSQLPYVSQKNVVELILRVEHLIVYTYLRAMTPVTLKGDQFECALITAGMKFSDAEWVGIELTKRIGKEFEKRPREFIEHFLGQNNIEVCLYLNECALKKRLIIWQVYDAFKVKISQVQ